MADAMRAHHMRITTHGKMHGWVEFALDFLEKNAERPLVLHTLPAEFAPRDPSGPHSAPSTSSLSKPGLSKASDATKSTGPPPTNAPALALAPAPAVDTAPAPAPSSDAQAPAAAKERRGMAVCTSTIPRLVSVTEIIKREYLLRTRASLVGLHQYTELCCLEDMDTYREQQARSAESSTEDGELVEDEETVRRREAERRKAELEAALGGKRHIRIHKTPYMRITLSRREHTDLIATGATYQPPATRQISKSAKARLKRRIRKQAEVADDTRDEEAIVVDDSSDSG